MVNISKKKIEENVFVSINKRFVDTIYNLGSKKSIKLFLEDILTPSEKIVLIKRLAIIFMLYEHISMYRIHKILNVSESTVKKIALEVEKGEHLCITKIVEKKKNRDLFWADIEVILRCGMPEMGKGRWKFLDDIYGKYGTK
jgi:uncharacterized protein YerC